MPERKEKESKEGLWLSSISQKSCRARLWASHLCPLPVNDVVNGAIPRIRHPVQPDRDHMMHINPRSSWCANRILKLDGCDVEEAVDTQPLRRVDLDIVTYFVGGETELAVGLLPHILRGNIVGGFRLVKIGAAIVAIPNGLKLLEVLNEEAIRGDVVAVDGDPVV
jgi:hypothetical protein